MTGTPKAPMRSSSRFALISNSPTCGRARAIVRSIMLTPATSTNSLSPPIRRAKPPASTTPMTSLRDIETHASMSFPAICRKRQTMGPAIASEQSHDLAIRPDVDRIRGRHFGQARHGHDLAADRHHEFGARRKPDLAHIDDVIGRRALGVGIGREAVLGLRDADGELGVTHRLERRELVLDRLVRRYVLGAVDLARDGADLLEEWHLVGIEELQFAPPRLADLHHGSGNLGGAFAAHRPMIGHEGFDPELGAG